jgi:hypothetical protein
VRKAELGGKSAGLSGRWERVWVIGSLRQEKGLDLVYPSSRAILSPAIDPVN